MVSTFLKRHGIDVGATDIGGLLASFASEMEAGLAGRPSSLAMIPSYLGADAPIPVGRKVIVLDAGGTNLRVGIVQFDVGGAPRISDFAKYAMPGVEREVSADGFFSLLAGYVRPLLGKADDIGFCFSYPCEITPDCDGRLLNWSKQIKAPEVVGRLVGAELRARLEPLGFKGRVTVMNDTVATLLAGVSAGIAHSYSAFVGVILGTGTNTATVVDNSAFAKVPGLPAGSMIVNMETGDFAPLPLSDFDRTLHSQTMDPGRYNLEKQIAGGYLGHLGLVAVKAAAAEGLLSAEATKGIAAMESLSNKDFDDFCDDPLRAGGALSLVPMTDADRRAIQEIGVAIYSRAAVLSAVNVAAAVIRSGGGLDPLAPVCVNIDGSTYYKTRTAAFRSLAEEKLRSILAPRGIHFRTVCVDDAPVIGAAVAGLVRGR